MLFVILEKNLETNFYMYFWTA